ncbi:MAG TPA: CBS domain-containing protein [Steroidobacteraceae bacterium]|nr:CBS domain-containing protein [Steroidobacteraceae bacterium]
MVLETVGPPVLHGTVGGMLEVKGTRIFAVEPSTMVYDAIARMDEWRVGALLVMQGERLIGIVSERDYTRRVILRGRASRDTPVEDIMTRDVITVRRDTSLGDCLGIVTKHGIRHLPVVEDDRVVGLISIGDLVRTVLAQQAEQISSLKSYIQSDYPS